MRNKAGFTLIELIVAVVIIGIFSVACVVGFHFISKFW